MRGNVVPRRSQTVDTDATVKNKWHWNWLELETEYKGETFLNSFKKNLEFLAKCTVVCHCEICYAFSGKQAVGPLEGKITQTKSQESK